VYSCGLDGGPSSIPRHSVWDLRWTKCNWNIFFKYFGFFLCHHFACCPHSSSFIRGEGQWNRSKAALPGIQPLTTPLITYYVLILHTVMDKTGQHDILRLRLDTSVSNTYIIKVLTKGSLTLVSTENVCSFCEHPD
jgi:hypothetical protein